MLDHAIFQEINKAIRGKVYRHAIVPRQHYRSEKVRNLIDDADEVVIIAINEPEED